MWPFALLALACIPMMGFATSLEMKNFLGEDVGDDNAKDETSSPGGILMETLLNMTTVSALTMEEARFKNFEDALSKSEEHYVRDGFMQGKTASRTRERHCHTIFLIYLYPNRLVIGSQVSLQDSPSSSSNGSMAFRCGGEDGFYLTIPVDMSSMTF
jgi:ABC transporter transmembrane region